MAQNNIKLVIGGVNGRKDRFYDVFTRCLEVLKREKGLYQDVEGQISLNLISDDEIQKINKKYRQKDVPTDVVSLSYMGKPGFPGDDLLGEIFISMDTAERQAQEHGKSFDEELDFLFVHGVLHVFGYDHLAKVERKVMFDLQDEILA